MKTPEADPSASSDRISELLRASGRRPVLDGQRKERMREAVEHEWRETVRQRRSRQRWAGVAAAAMIVLGFSLFWTLRETEGLVVVATTMRVTGPVSFHRKDVAAPIALSGAIPLGVGDEISTDTGGRLLARIGETVLVRLDERSSVQIVSREALRLTRGALYVEVPEHHGASQPLQFLTAFGNVQHVGTRFEVRLANDALVVRVRDGIASFDGGSGVHRSVNGGQELLVNSASVQVRKGPSSSDEVWAWTQHISPPLTIEGRSLEETLTALAHEGGLEVVYADDSARTAARAAVLHGSIEGYTTREAIQTLLAGSELDFYFRDGRVYVKDNR